MESTEESKITVRSFRADDLPACRRLYVEGLLGGKLAENDSGLDIEDIESAYMKTPGNHFWVGEIAPVSDGKTGEVVGMIGVQHHETGVGEIRRRASAPTCAAAASAPGWLRRL